MAEEDLKIGDTVQLKSGGPAMTIRSIENYSGGRQEALCDWFDGNDKKEGKYPLTSLKLYTEASDDAGILQTQ